MRNDNLKRVAICASIGAHAHSLSLAKDMLREKGAILVDESDSQIIDRIRSISEPEPMVIKDYYKDLSSVIYQPSPLIKASKHQCKRKRKPRVKGKKTHRKSKRK